VIKENQILYKSDKIIDSSNEYATLVDVNIFAGDQIIVRDSEIHENRDIDGKLFFSGKYFYLFKWKCKFHNYVDLFLQTSFAMIYIIFFHSSQRVNCSLTSWYDIFLYMHVELCVRVFFNKNT